MNRSLQAPITPGRLFGAWVCLVAVFLLWSPMWAAAWHEKGMSCCADGMCMAHSHSKSNSSQTGGSTSHESAMNCDHGGANGMANCSMSCCHQSAPFFATAAIFVLPEPALLNVPLTNICALLNFTVTEFLRSFEPLSPPPRATFFSI